MTDQSEDVSLADALAALFSDLGSEHPENLAARACEVMADCLVPRLVDPRDVGMVRAAAAIAVASAEAAPHVIELRQKCPDHGVRWCPECDDPEIIRRADV